MKNYKTLARKDYGNPGEIQLIATKRTLTFLNPWSKRVYELTPTAPNVFSLKIHQGDGTDADGVVECSPTKQSP